MVTATAPNELPVSRTIAHDGWKQRHVACIQVPSPKCDACMGPSSAWDQTALIDRHCFGYLPCVTLRRWQSMRGIYQTPITALRAQPGSPVGVHMEAIVGVEVKPLRNSKRVIGNYWEDADAMYCQLGGVRPTNTSASRPDQARQVFSIIRNLLENIGCDFSNVVRTWFYNDRIADWYAQFNQVRTDFFEAQRIIMPPASTGIGVANASRTALMAKLIAVKPKTDRIKIRRVDSPLQCEATRYGSSFSRAIEVADSRSRVLYISGTASIEAGGKTVHVADAATQIEKTMQVVEALLHHNDMSLSDATRAIAYFRDQKDVGLWSMYVASHNLPQWPVAVVQCDICRPDLLFELELDAAVSL